MSAARRGEDLVRSWHVGEPGHGEAGEVALHVGDEGRDAGGRKALDDALQRDRLAGAGRAGDQAVAVGALELELLRIGAARVRADEDAGRQARLAIAVASFGLERLLSLGRRSEREARLVRLSAADVDPDEASGALPRLTSSSTLVRPGTARSVDRGDSTCAGVVTAWRLTEMITSPRWRPFSAASLFGSTAVMTTPRAVGGRLSRAGELGRQRLQRQAERAAAARPGVVLPVAWSLLAAAAGCLASCFLGRTLADRDADRLAACRRG